MYAVFQSGGKQHRVSEGQTVRWKSWTSQLAKLLNSLKC